MKIDKLIFQPNKPIFVYKGIKIFDTKHAVQRRIERANDLTEKDFQVIFKRIIEKILAEKDYFDSATDYLFYSVSYKQGLVVYYKYPVIRVITILPKEAYYPKPKTIGVLIEQYITENNLITENEALLKHLLNLIPQEKLKLINEKYDFEKLILPEYDLEFYFSKGKLYDMNKELVVIP